MKLAFLFGWGFVIYAVMYLAWTGVVLYGFADNTFAKLFMLCVLVLVATIAGRSLAIPRWEDILPYSLTWLTIIFFLDLIFAARIHGFDIFMDPNLWFTYALVVFVPLISPNPRHHS